VRYPYDACKASQWARLSDHASLKQASRPSPQDLQPRSFIHCTFRYGLVARARRFPAMMADGDWEEVSLATFSTFPHANLAQILLSPGGAAASIPRYSISFNVQHHADICSFRSGVCCFHRLARKHCRLPSRHLRLTATKSCFGQGTSSDASRVSMAPNFSDIPHLKVEMVPFVSYLSMTRGLSRLLREAYIWQCGEEPLSGISGMIDFEDS
jgi:hypothetical protein